MLLFLATYLITAKQRDTQLCYMPALQENVFFEICCQKYSSDTFFPFYIYAKLKNVATSVAYNQSLSCRAY